VSNYIKTILEAEHSDAISGYQKWKVKKEIGITNQFSYIPLNKMLKTEGV
jgi:hypothetical protein